MIRVALLRLVILGAALSALTGCAAISALSKASQPLHVT